MEESKQIFLDVLFYYFSVSFDIVILLWEYPSSLISLRFNFSSSSGKHFLNKLRFLPNQLHSKDLSVVL